MWHKKIFLKAFTLSIPICIAYLPLGVVFGLVFENEGYYWLLGPVMSLLVYGGAVQFLTLSMLDQGQGTIQILIACFLLAVRNLFYGSAFFTRFSTFSKLTRIYMIFALVDATYALLLATPSLKTKKDDEKFCIYLGLLIHVYWIVGTVIGAMFGNLIPEIHGLNIVLPVLFLIITLEHYTKSKKLWPFAIAMLAWFFMQYMLPSYALVGAIVISSLTAIVILKLINKTDAKNINNLEPPDKII